MRLSISNILWTDALDTQALICARQAGAEGIEVAPTRIAPWAELTTEVVRAYRRRMESFGLVIPALQAILYDRKEACLLGDVQGYHSFFEHVLKVGEYAAELGATRMVLGAPKNRLRGDLSVADAIALAAERLRPLAEQLHALGVALVIEAVPPSYGGDFIHTATEAAQLVRLINHSGVRLHVDTGALILANENARDIVAAHADILSHVHISRPELAAVTEALPVDRDLAEALKQANYSGWVSIEISPKDDALACIEHAFAVTRALYGTSGVQE